ncbi:MAG: S1/P1 nuclease [Bacteriovoracaceae bacterium]|nr:S1/P1 nuclease [Bacteriovoracaceae bacterium]
MKLILLSIFSLLISSAAFGWGQIGHRVIGEVAMKHLNKNARKQVRRILEGRDLAIASTYADFVKSDKAYRKYNSWHYLNAPKGQSYMDSTKSKKGDVVQGIIYFEDILRNKKTSAANQKLALRYLSHLVGDVHQPLHAGYPSDRGGNHVDLTWFEKDTNIHWVWDEGMIDMLQLSYTEYVKHFYFPTKKEIKIWRKSSYVEWVNESRSYMDAAYKAVGSGKYWEYKYQYQFRDIVAGRLIRAGVRLGHMLNQIFDRRPISKHMLKDRAAIKASMK